MQSIQQASFRYRSHRSSLSSRIYVTENGTLKGYITMAVLLTHQPNTPVADLLREMEEMLREVCHVHVSAIAP